MSVLAATGKGETVILASGRSDSVRDDIREGKTTGTLFQAKGEAVVSWKRWIGFGAPASCLDTRASSPHTVRASLIRPRTPVLQT